MLNQSCGCWLLSNALHVAITMTLKLRKKIGIVPSMYNMMEDDYDVVFKLSFPPFNIRK